MTLRRSFAARIIDPHCYPFEVADHVDGTQLLPIAPEQLTPDRLKLRFASHSSSLSGTSLPGSIPAAVLVPLVQREKLHVLLTQRTAHLTDHAGQISFPGGRCEPSDQDAVHTALRESAEEIGLTTPYVQVLGCLDDIYTVSGFRVTPVVGLVDPNFPPLLDSFEVAEVFEVPLPFLMHPGNHQRRWVNVQEGEGERRHGFLAIPYQDHGTERFIWGATAEMLRNFYHFLRVG